MKKSISTTFARSGGWLVGARRVRAAMMLLLLAMLLMPQTAAAGNDYEAWFTGKNVTEGDDSGGHYFIFTTCYYQSYGYDESWCNGEGLVV